MPEAVSLPASVLTLLVVGAAVGWNMPALMLPGAIVVRLGPPVDPLSAQRAGGVVHDGNAVVAPPCVRQVGTRCQ